MGPIVDSHVHVWDGTAAGKDPGPVRIRYSAQAEAPVELFMEYMDEAGVEKAVLVQPWFYHWDNSYMVECVRRYPEKFQGVCVVDPRGVNAPAALKKWRDQGITGVRLRKMLPGENPTPGPWLGTDDTLPLWEAIAETDTIVCILNKDIDLIPLTGILNRFPSIRVVIDHLNNPVPSEGLNQVRFQSCIEIASHPSVYIKFSAFHLWCDDRYPYRSGMPFVEAAVKVFGADRCMWGSDFPHVLASCGYIRNMNLLTREATFLSKAQLKSIMGGTAYRLWFAS